MGQETFEDRAIAFARALELLRDGGKDEPDSDEAIAVAEWLLTGSTSAMLDLQKRLAENYLRHWGVGGAGDPRSTEHQEGES